MSVKTCLLLCYKFECWRKKKRYWGCFVFVFFTSFLW